MPARAADEAVIAQRQVIESFTEEGLRILGPCPPDLKETTIHVPLSDGTFQRTIVTWPTNTSQDTKKLPLVVLFHGGGWTNGSPEFMLSPARAYASILGAVVASPSYNAWDAVAWLSRPENIKTEALEGEKLEVDPGLGLVVGGVSAGAHLAAVIAGVSAAVAAGEAPRLAEGLGSLAHPVTGVFLSVPLLLHESMVPAEYASIWTSHVEHADAPMINADGLARTLESLDADYHSPWFSPLNLDLARLKGLHAPKAYVQAGQLDILRDDAVVYERALRDKGVAETRIDVIQDVDHSGWCCFPVESAHSDEMRTKSLDGMAWLLGKEWDRSQKLPY